MNERLRVDVIDVGLHGIHHVATLWLYLQLTQWLSPMSIEEEVRKVVHERVTPKE